MRILITSIVDLRKSAHNRLHQFIKYLSINNDITVLCINDWWKDNQTDVNLYNKSFIDILDKVDISYFTKRKISPYLQESLSLANIDKSLNANEYDVHLNYNTLISGYFVTRKLNRKGVNTVYDVADNLIDMIRTSPQIPSLIRPIGGIVGDTVFHKNIKLAASISMVTTYLQNLCKIPLEKSHIIPNGVDTELFTKCPSSDLKETLGLTDSFVIGYVGVLREWVDLEPVFCALKKINGNNKDIKFLVVGEEGHYKKNINLAKKYGIGDKVVFTGTVPYNEVPKYISCMDVSLIPFIKNRITEDPCPLKLFEYMACGIPVVSSIYISLVQDKVQYASTNDEYKSVIMKLYNDEALRNTLGKENRNFVENNFNWSKISLELERLLEEVAV